MQVLVSNWYYVKSLHILVPREYFNKNVNFNDYNKNNTSKHKMAILQIQMLE